MDFLKISIWLLTTVLSVNSSSKSHLDLDCNNRPIYPFNYAKIIHDQKNCFCFNHQRDFKKVPEVIHHGGLFTERLVYYAYKDLLTGRITLYIPNREKQVLIPDLAYEEEDIIYDNPNDFLHSYNDLKVIIEIHENKYITNEPQIDETVSTAVSTDIPTTTIEAPTITTDELTVTNDKTAPTEEPTVTTKKSTFPTEEPTISTEKYTVTTEQPTITTKRPTDNEPTVTIEEETVTNVIRTTTIDEPSGTTERPATINDEPSVTTEIPAVSTEKPTGTTVSTFITDEPTTITNEPSVTTEIPTVITEKPTGTTVSTFITEEPTTITDEPPVTTEIPTVITEKPTGTTVSTFITEEPTTSEIIFTTEATTFITKVPSTEEPLTTESPQPAVTTEDTPFVTPKKVILIIEEPTTEKPSPTKPPEPTIITAEPTTFEEFSPVTISPHDDSKRGKVFSLKDLYYIIEFIQTKKNEPMVDLWEQILKELKLDKAQFNKYIEFNKGDGKIEFEIRDDSDFEHNSYTFDLWFQQQLDGFSESDHFISLVEIKEYVRNILLENGMIVTEDGLLTDVEGALLDLRELKLRPILIGKPLSINKMFEQKDQISDFLIPSDSPYMQAIVVTLSNPSMILGIIPLGKTIIKKNVQKSVTIPPHQKYKGMVKEWLQNGNKYSKNSNTRKENLWFNIKGRPKLHNGLKDLYSLPSQKKIIKHKYFEGPKNTEAVINFKSPKDRYKVNPSRLVEISEENDLRNLDALKNQLFKNQNKFATKKDLLTAWKNDGIVQTDEIQPLHLNVDHNELETWENILKGTKRSENDLLTAWKNAANTQTDGELIYSLKDDDSVKLDILNNQLILDSKLSPTNGLLTNWQDFSHLQPDNVKFDRLELDALNHKLVNRPISSDADDMSSSWQNREKVHAASGQVISFKTDHPSELDALKNQLLNNPNLYGKAGIKLLAALQRNEVVKEGTGETTNFKVDNLNKLDQLRILLKDPTIFAKTAKNLLSALQRKGIVQAGNGEAVKFKVHNPRELEALRNQLLTHPKIFSRAAKEILSVMEHNGIGLSDIAPVINETAATSLEDSVLSAKKNVYTQEYWSPQEDPWPSEDAVGSYDEVEDDITGRIVGGSAATGSGAPLSMKGRMKDF